VAGQIRANDPELLFKPGGEFLPDHRVLGEPVKKNDGFSLPLVCEMDLFLLKGGMRHGLSGLCPLLSRSGVSEIKDTSF